MDSSNEQFTNDKQVPQEHAPPVQSQPPKYPTATPLASVQKHPTAVDCPACHVREMTIVERVSGGTTHAWALICCCVLGLPCIPYMTSKWKDAEHSCGNCKTLLALYTASGRTEVLVGRN